MMFGRFVELVDPPASSTAPGKPGRLAYDEMYLYICIALNTWRRISLLNF